MELNEFQRKVIEKFNESDRNLLISAPTGSGKSFLAMLMATMTKYRVLYTVPLRALALQLNEDYKNKITPMLKAFPDSTALVSEVYESDPEDLNERVVFTTYEKADAVLRRHYTWAERSKVIIIDEIHNVGDKERGQAIENLVAWAMAENKRLIMMSATVPQIEKIAEITEAEIIETKDRPIPLYKAVKIGKTLIFDDNEKVELKEDLVHKLVRKNKVVMMFTSTRKKAEELFLIYDRKFPGKVAFFHAGLPGSQKIRLMEETRKGKYNIIISTTALSQGMNFPFYAVIFDDLKLPIIEYGRFMGWKAITPIEFDQICGRAGRPGYDSEGLCVIEATNIREAERLTKKYFEQRYEDLIGRHVLEDFLLSLLSKYVYARPNEILEATKHTLSFRGADENIIKEKLQYLQENGMIYYDREGYSVSGYGRAVAESYFDVKDAIAYRNVLEKNDVTKDEVINAVMENENVLNNAKGEDPRQIFDNWIKGVDEKVIIKMTKNMTLTDLNKLLETINWQFYGVYRITKALNRTELSETLRMIFLEARYGVPSKALALVQLPGIGRKRAIELMRNGIYNKGELCQNKEIASKVISKKMIEVICI